MRRFHSTSLCIATTALGLLGATARTASADEHVLVVLDTTGSMTASSIPGMNRFAVAKQRITTFLETVPSVATEYALWTFDGTTFTELAGFEAHLTRTAIKGMLPLAPSSGVTPLAHTACEAVERLINYLPDELHTKRIFLQTDGGENSTQALDQCGGPSSATLYPALDVNSWQWKVRNMACTFDPTNPGPCLGGASPFSLIVDVDLLFDFVPSLARAGLPPLEVGPRTDDRFASAIVLPPVNADAAFFGGLARETGGRFTAITSTTPPAVAAPRPGDANTDGCVNVLDRALVLQQFGTANPATDFNRDGIVNTFDLQTVLQNFGKGCK